MSLWFKLPLVSYILCENKECTGLPETLQFASVISALFIWAGSKYYDNFDLTGQRETNWTMYEGCSEIIETITIFSKGLNVIQNNLHSHQVLYIWGLGLNYLTDSFNGYNLVAFFKTDTPTTSEHVPLRWRSLHGLLDLLSFKWTSYNQ